MWKLVRLSNANKRKKYQKDFTGNIKRIHRYIDKSEIGKRLVLEARVNVHLKITSSTSPIVFRCLHRKVPVPSSPRSHQRPLSEPAGRQPFSQIFRCQSRRGPVVLKGGADYVRYDLKNNCKACRNGIFLGEITRNIWIYNEAMSVRPPVSKPSFNSIIF